ncbi:alpha/beta hydrolase [Jatrophihabitans sp. YIM 134969]
MRVVFVHGACVRDGAWWWGPTGNLLQQRGIVSVTPALPSCGETGVAPGASGPGLAEDVAVVREVLLGSDEPTVVVGHSYGGTVMTEAAAGVGTVRHLVYVSSYLLEVGQSQSEFGDGSVPPFLDVDPAAGTFGVRPGLLVETFLQDCPPDVQAGASEHLARQNLAVLGTPVGAAAWHDVPTTYVVCGDDRGTPAAAQREFARRADRVVEFPTGHHPFLSQPAAVRDLLLEL